jgi:hypothetical protein
MNLQPVNIESQRSESSNSILFDKLIKSTEAPTSKSLISRYYQGILRAEALIAEQTAGRVSEDDFQPGALPRVLSKALVDFFAPATHEQRRLPSYRERNLRLLNLLSNSDTQTTKLTASLCMVARAINHIEQTGESILIVITTSGNKGTALRYAVERAIEMGLVQPAQLRTMMILPSCSNKKLRSSPLFTNSTLRELNPIVLYNGQQPERVKPLGKEFQRCFAEKLLKEQNTRIWYSLGLDNYRIADSALAFLDYENALNQDSGKKRLNAQAVSSAYGLLGYHLGREVLVNEGLTDWDSNPGYFLVQQINIPDMILHCYFNSFSKSNIPEYFPSQIDGRLIQRTDAHFPLILGEAEAPLEQTFYTREPVTSPQVTSMIHRHGGGGIAVSTQECLAQLPLIRKLLEPQGLSIPKKAEDIREWAVIIGLTGIINAIDRDIIPEDVEVTFFATGFSKADDFENIGIDNLSQISNDKPLDVLWELACGAK